MPEIRRYVDNAGIDLFGRWVRSLKDRAAVARIFIRVDRLKHGNPGDAKSVGEGVFELRLDYGPGYRIYFAKVGDLVVLLLLGGDKSTQNRDIREAIACWQNYKRQNATKEQKGNT